MSLTVVQVIAGGLLLGAVYALFASGLTLIWGMMNVINFAHGDFVMLGMYTAFVVYKTLGLGPAASVPIALAEFLGTSVIHPQDNLLLVSFGGGLTWAAAVVRWADVAALHRERLGTLSAAA